MIFVKQYGYYRCGTNFTRALLERNFRCRVLVNELGSKHLPPIDYYLWLLHPDKQVPQGLPDAIDSGQLRCVVTAKDPYAWLASFLLYWEKTYGRHPREGFLREYIDIYSRSHRAWAGVAKPLRYEDLLLDYETAVGDIGERLKLTPRHARPRQIKRRVDPHPHLRGRNAPLDHAYFLKRRYLDDLSPLHKRLVTRYTDWQFFAGYGYYSIA